MLSSLDHRVKILEPWTGGRHVLPASRVTISTNFEIRVPPLHGGASRFEVMVLRRPVDTMRSTTTIAEELDGPGLMVGPHSVCLLHPTVFLTPHLPAERHNYE